MSAKKTKKHLDKSDIQLVSAARPFWKQLLISHKMDILAIACLYLLLTAFFAPVVFEGKNLSPAADMVASAGMNKIGEEAFRSGHFPLWNPTLFCGLPMFASLQYALFVYPPEYFIRVLSYIFGGGGYRIWLFHYYLAGIFMYLLARHYRCGRFSSWIAGAAYAFSPQLIVLAEVGHGSKLMGMTYLPLIWLMIDRLRIRPSISRALALGVVFAVEILALHPQVAAYGAMLMGLFLLYYGVSALIKKELQPYKKLFLYFCGGMAVSLAISAILWVSVLDYSGFSIRAAQGSTAAGGSGAGVGWDYATGWSFHPLESITFLFPDFMGFGGQTYWGTVGTPAGQPFTHNPMYFGFVVLFLAIIAMSLLPRSKWSFPLAIGSAAWILSFGKYLPLLYGPMFRWLPMFNKFRAPVMGQVLLMLSMVLLAALGIDALIRKIREEKSTKRLQKILWWVAGTAMLIALISWFGENIFGSIYRSFALMLMPKTQPQLLQQATEMARTDVARVMLLVSVLAGLCSLTLARRIKLFVFAGVFILILLIDLWQVNRKLVTFTPKSYSANLFQSESVVKRLQQDDDKFRIHPIDSRYRAVNWWSYFGLESTVGYFGAKMSGYQKLMTLSGLERWEAIYDHPKLLDAMNVRYIISSYPLDAIFAELQRQGRGSPLRPASEYSTVLRPRSGSRSGVFVYKNEQELPRARLVSEYKVIEELDPTFSEMLGAEWEPARMTLLDRRPDIEPEAGGASSAEIIEYKNESVTIQVNCSSPKLLVLADSYYPSGWKALIDGEETPIMRADGVLRAIAVPAGDHEVLFVFKPFWFWVGFWVSLVSLLGVLGLGVSYVLKGRE